MDNKPFYKSKTIIGLAVMILGLLIKQLNLPIGEAEIAPIIAYIFEGIGAILVFVGRLKAEKKISI